jgi:hypothetical protein
MYLEFVFCFVLGWLAYAWSERRRAITILLAGAQVLIVEAIILTLTRSALLATVGALLVVVLARWQQSRFDAFARAAVCGLVTLAALVGADYMVNPLFTLRLRTESDLHWFQAQYSVPPLPPIHANETVTVSVQLRNSGQRTWNAEGAQPVLLFYHWLNADRSEMRVVEGLRTPLPRDITPGETITLVAQVRGPAQAGDYVLGWDMVREDAFWFSVLGWPLYEVPVSILPGSAMTEIDPGASHAANVMSELRLERGTLWAAALRMVAAHPVLGVGAGNFRLVLGHYLGYDVWDKRLHANNTYLEMFADAGLLGGAAFMLLVVSALWHSARALRQPQDLQTAIWTATCAAALGVFFVHGITDYFLEFVSTFGLFWLTLGCVAALSHPERRSL